MKDSAVIFKKHIRRQKVNKYINTEMKVSAVKKIKLRKELARDGNWQCMMVVVWGWGMGEEKRL